MIDLRIRKAMGSVPTSQKQQQTNKQIKKNAINDGELFDP